MGPRLVQGLHDQAKVTGDWDLFLRGREFDAKRVRVASRAGAGEYEEDEIVVRSRCWLLDTPTENFLLPF